MNTPGGEADRDLLQQALAGLHAESWAWALNCCDRNRHDAEDVLHATYLKILDGRARFDGRASMLTWLFAVIRRTAADMRRRRLVTAWFSGHDEAAASADVCDAPTAATSPESELVAKQARRRIADTLATLARRQREVLLLVYYHELTVEQAAAAMGVSLGAARQHYARGKRALRARLEAQGVYP